MTYIVIDQMLQSKHDPGLYGMTITVTVHNLVSFCNDGTVIVIMESQR